MKKLLLFIALCFFIFPKANITEISPSLIEPHSFSEQGEKEFNAKYKIWEALMIKMNKYDIQLEDLSKEEMLIYDSIDGTWSNYWQTTTDGCSWYCGGGPYKVSGSSYLKSNNSSITYNPSNAMDFSHKTAWVEGVSGDGIGEFLTYYFEKGTAPVDTFIISNGYVKSEQAYLDNNRAKKIKVYLNDKPYAILNLHDIRSNQYFKINPIGDDRDNDFQIKFEILEVYKGRKYSDTAISEIFFDGYGVH
ncbi:MAG: hypothetical protein JXM74_04085 [Fusobacteriaceae bacterium]|nr:hypothetical protein [Fusobacteriaceae bacterium]MBN2837912.1 hypothetical protein [Fusobacteriaceae bacterium]